VTEKAALVIINNCYSWWYSPHVYKYRYTCRWWTNHCINNVHILHKQQEI